MYIMRQLLVLNVSASDEIQHNHDVDDCQGSHQHERSKPSRHGAHTVCMDHAGACGGASRCAVLNDASYTWASGTR